MNLMQTFNKDTDFIAISSLTVLKEFFSHYLLRNTDLLRYSCLLPLINTWIIKYSTPNPIF